MPPKAKKSANKAKTAEKPPNAAPRKAVNKKMDRLEKQRRQRWFMAGLVVVVGVAASFYLSPPPPEAKLKKTGPKGKKSVDTKAEQFINTFVCQATGAFCDPALVHHHRSQMAAKSIPGGKTLVKIPRALQIWDLDALQDFWIQQELKDAKHAITGNSLDSGAFLAAYLCRRFITNPDEHDSLLPYYEILPSLRQLARHHPTLWDSDALEQLLNDKSSTFAVVKAYQDMMDSEYKAFEDASDLFKEEISHKDYARMRVLVMSRSFGTGKPEGVSDEEFERYNEEMGIDLTKGCRAMVPLLDMYNHHAKPNVEWKYDMDEQAFVVTSVSEGIPAGQEIINSYGTYTDSHLFAKFGFVNGDGSGYTQATIAVFHRLFDMGLKQQFSYLPRNDTLLDEIAKQQKYIMGRYLQFDDGYGRCIENATTSPKAYELKQWKLRHLVRFANRGSNWIVNMKPRNKDAKPAATFDEPSSTQVPLFDMKNLDFDGSKLMSVCRLIALTWEDYDNNAIAELKSAYESTTDPIAVNFQTEILEYRSLMCLARFSGLGMSRYGKEWTFQNAIMYVDGLNKNSWGSGKWAAGHVRLGEFLTLDLLNKMANSGAREYSEKLSPDDPSLDAMSKLAPIRVQPCDWNYTEALVNATSI